MNAEKRLSLVPRESEGTILARAELLSSLRDPEYRAEFVAERVRSSMALQIRALREQRNKMSQKQLGDAIGMAQTWVSRLENPDYGKMSVATLLRLAAAFDTDLEIKFRPFSRTINALPHQTDDYFVVPSFNDEFEKSALSEEEQNRGFAHLERDSACRHLVSGSALEGLTGYRGDHDDRPLHRGATSERTTTLQQYATR